MYSTEDLDKGKCAMSIIWTNNLAGQNSLPTDLSVYNLTTQLPLQTYGCNPTNIGMQSSLQFPLICVFFKKFNIQSYSPDIREFHSNLCVCVCVWFFWAYLMIGKWLLKHNFPHLWIFFVAVENPKFQKAKRRSPFMIFALRNLTGSVIIVERLQIVIQGKIRLFGYLVIKQMYEVMLRP